jgi:hypothetical protein
MSVTMCVDVRRCSPCPRADETPSGSGHSALVPYVNSYSALLRFRSLGHVQKSIKKELHKKMSRCPYKEARTHDRHVLLYKKTQGFRDDLLTPMHLKFYSKKVQQSLYTPWRRLGGEEI